MCGLAGYSGKKKPNMVKLALLGCLMTTRGTDSCGIYYGDNIVKGTKDMSNFIKFYKDTNFDFSELSHNTVFIHTRKTSWGTSSEENAHPFGFPLKSPEYDFVLMHNGHLSEPTNLAKKYGYDGFHKNFSVDSQLLGDVLRKGDVSILSYYEGDAALAFSWTTDPDTVYLWKGAHRFNDSKNLLVERPLHYVYDDDGIYFASEINALLCISSNPVKEVPNNTLLKITKGEIVSKKKIKRYYHEVIKATPTTKRGSSIIVHEYDESTEGISVIEPKKPKTPPEETILAVVRSRAKGKIFWFDGLYYRNGHLADGTHYISEDGSYDSKIPYYFHNGLLAKDYNSYVKLKDCKLATKESIEKGRCFVDVQDFVYPKSVLKRGDYFYIAGSKYSATGSYAPIFSFLRLTIETGTVSKVFVLQDEAVKENNKKHIRNNSMKTYECDADGVCHPVNNFEETPSAGLQLDLLSEEMNKQIDEAVQKVSDAIEDTVNDITNMCMENGGNVSDGSCAKLNMLTELYDVLKKKETS